MMQYGCESLDGPYTNRNPQGRFGIQLKKLESALLAVGGIQKMLSVLFF